MSNWVPHRGPYLHVSIMPLGRINAAVFRRVVLAALFDAGVGLAL
jgi:hypothetical protein